MGASILGGIMSPFLTKKLEKRNTSSFRIISWCSRIIFSIFIILFFVPLMIVINFISGIFDGAGYITLTSMVADCVEYGEWKTGKRSEGMIFSLNIFKSKIASAIGGSLCGYILAYIGYTANESQSTFTLNGIHLIRSYNFN